MSPSSLPYATSWMCLTCGARLVPLSYSYVEGVEGRPNLKCPKCGQAYRLGESAEWFATLE